MVSRNDSSGSPMERLFENLPELITPKTVEEVFGPKVKTVYDWHYRGKLRKVPQGLILKFNRKLYIRTEVLKRWILSQNPSFS
jgi:hypothetical protein